MQSEKCINVYQISEAQQKPIPFKKIDTDCKGLSAAWVGSDRIYMAFMGTMERPSSDILVYTHDYELIKRIKVDSLIMISSMTLTPCEKYLICAHIEVKMTIINTSDFTVWTDSIFEDVSVWRVVVTTSGIIVLATTNGLYTGRL